MRITLWINKATYTHSEYVTFIPFPLQQWLHERCSVLRYTYMACLVYCSLDYLTTLFQLIRLHLSLLQSVANTSLTPGSKLDEVATLLICIRKRFSSNLDRDTDYPGGGLSWFSSVLPAKSRVVRLIRPWLLSSTLFPTC